MTLGEVKVETLRLIGANSSDDIRAESLEELLLEEKYKTYLVNMVGPINRALSIFERRGVRGEVPEGGRRRIGHETPNTLDLIDLGVGDTLADILPFYIKSELLASEDPEAASFALTLFERNLSEMMAHSGKRQERVCDVMGRYK